MAGGVVSDDKNTISVAVDGFYSEDVATKVGMDIIRRQNGVAGAKHIRTYQPRPDLPTRWRVEATYSAVPRKAVPA